MLLAHQNLREFLGMEEGQTFMEYTGDLVVSILIVGLGLSLMIIVVWLMQFLSVKLMNKFNNSKDGKAFNDYFDKLDAAGYIRVNRTAGLDMIYPVKKLNPMKILEEYYKNN